MTVKISGNSSASTPSFAGDDGDSGLHATADQVQLVTNGTVGVTVDSSQNVGIGTTTPGTKLEVGGAITSKTSAAGLNDQSIIFSESGSGNAYGVRLGHVSNTELAFERYDGGWAETVRIDGGGNVGIGNATPGSYNSYGLPLVVTNAGSAHSGITITSSTAGTGNIHFADGSSGGSSYRGIIQYNHNGDYMSFHTTEQERLRIGNTGLIDTKGGQILSYAANSSYQPNASASITCLASEAVMYRLSVSIHYGGPSVDQEIGYLIFSNTSGGYNYDQVVSSGAITVSISYGGPSTATVTATGPASSTTLYLRMLRMS